VAAAFTAGAVAGNQSGRRHADPRDRRRPAGKGAKARQRLSGFIVLPFFKDRAKRSPDDLRHAAILATGGGAQLLAHRL
jgi:hypothetical protein